MLINIEKSEIELLCFVVEAWNTLSNTAEPESYSYMTDHCHTEYDEVEYLIERIKKEFARAANQTCVPSATEKRST